MSKLNKIHILICEDDKYFRIALKNKLEHLAHITEVDSEVGAFKILESQHFDMILIDMNIDGPLSGLKILKIAQGKEIHSIILSSQNEEETIEKAYEGGCQHYLSKMHYKEHLEPYVYKYVVSKSQSSLDKFFKDKFISENAQLKDQIKDICDINLKNKTIFISGETGVGKTLIAELLHYQTYDSSKPFIHLNCSELSDNLVESELFGHKKGAFTDASSDKKGKLELANGGTLFLDEIATMPISTQQKLLKAIEKKSFYPLGSEKEIQSNFTLITATCEDLIDKINKEEFRKDFYYRINGLTLNIPPLRERKEDILPLVKYFLKESPRRIILKADALNLLKSYTWPGNTRQLKKQIDLLASINKGIITAKDIILEDEFTTTGVLTPEQIQLINNIGLKSYIAQIEIQSVQSCLEKNDGKIAKTIKELKISSSAFYRIFEQVQMNN